MPAAVLHAAADIYDGPAELLGALPQSILGRG